MMGMADRNCGGTLPAGAARPWRTLTASLVVVVCCFVWLCIRQCHELILKTRAELAENEGAHVFARVAEAANQAKSSFLAMTGHDIRAQFNPALGFAAALLVMPLLDAQPRMPAAALAESADSFLYALNDTLDLSRLETGPAELAQPAFSPDSLVDPTVSIADFWADQQTAGLWTGDLGGDDWAAPLWHGAGGMQAIASMDGFNLPSGDIVCFNSGAAWQAHGAGDFDSDDASAAWPSLSLVSDSDAGFNTVIDWQESQPYYDLF
jgi:hypothetical protein